VVWRVVPTGLGHGSIWVNGHNLGRYPEKIPVKGLFIPGCWLHSGDNTLRIYDEDGRDAQQVTVQAEEGASRRVSMLTPSREYGFVDPFIGTAPSDVYKRGAMKAGRIPERWRYRVIGSSLRRLDGEVMTTVTARLFSLVAKIIIVAIPAGRGDDWWSCPGAPAIWLAALAG